jgi:hypothetical protein
MFQLDLSQVYMNISTFFIGHVFEDQAENIFVTTLIRN